MMLMKKRGVSEDEIDEPPANVMPKIASYKEATSNLQDVLNFPEAKGNMKIKPLTIS